MSRNDFTQPFWMVMSEKTNFAQMRHPTFDGAQAEAKRLAALNKNTHFFVLQFCGAAVVADPVQWIAADPIPF